MSANEPSNDPSTSAPTDTPKKRWPLLVGLAVAALSVLAAFTVTFVWRVGNGIGLEIDSSPRARAAREQDPYDLTSLSVMNTVILYVKDRYVEPARVQPKRMLLAGLNAIQRSVAPVLVDYQEGAPTLALQVNNERRTFKVDDVTGPLQLSKRWKEIFTFLQSELAHEEDLKLRDVEYAAVNGMLSTLDPHTILMSPEQFEDMQTTTNGEFGGLGIVISIRDGQLTVIKPMPGTPAAEKGLRRMDRIVKIGEESTLNMPVNDAVDRLRGRPGTQVSVWITREGPGGFREKKIELTRAVIHVASVESRMLESNVGYIKIKNFQGNTYDDMSRALDTLHDGNMKGLVLDLRDDPGGLLDQAVQVADKFLWNGTIVTTSSTDPSQRDEKFAQPEGTEPNYPIVVLVNSNSASASEIVAGALKGHDRALIVGERTFGKGSVQVLYPLQDHSGLKLTIAQYLTPGDISIQGVGIHPDVAVDSMTVDAEDIDIDENKAAFRESDLMAHLTHDQLEHASGSTTTLRYYLPPETRRRLAEAAPEDLEENERLSEFLIRFSRTLISRATRPGRLELLHDAQPVISEMRTAERARLATELGKLGINWTEGTDAGASTVEVTATTSAAENNGRAGQPLTLRVQAHNTGAAPLYQLRAVSSSDNGLFEGREFVFGRLMPGETKEWSTTLGLCETKDGRRECKLPESTPSRADGITLKFSEQHGHAPADVQLRVSTTALEHPRFAYSVQVADGAPGDTHGLRGDGDGVIEPGEVAAMFVRIRNVGQGSTLKTETNLRNLSGSGILLNDGRFSLSSLGPNQEQLVRFTFQVLPAFQGEKAKLQVSIADSETREYAMENVEVPIRTTTDGVTATERRPHTLAAETRVFALPATDARVIGQVKGGSLSVNTTGTRVGTFLRVDLGNGRPGWVSQSAAQATAGGPAGRLEETIDHMPPTLTLTNANVYRVETPTFRIQGRASDETRVRDILAYVGERKVFYRNNGSGDSPREVSFEFEAPLRDGMNVIQIFAREREEVVTRTTIFVRKDGPGGTLLATPKREGFFGEAASMFEDSFDLE